VCSAYAQDVRIGVLGLFHAHQITLRASRAALIVHAADESFVLEPGHRMDEAKISASEGKLFLHAAGRILQVSEITVAGRDGGRADFTLAVPAKVSRTYFGRLAVKSENGEVVPVVSMELETAVASVVQAESAPATPLEVLKAQAVVTRSYIVAGKGRHHNFDFCDLTHCQFLREPPHPDSAVANAVRATEGLVITYEDKAVATMFTRSCGGHTRTPAEVGIPVNGYPYFSVLCDYCYKNPSRWSRRVSRADAELLTANGEAGRLAIDRRLGWNAVPGNTYTTQTVNGQVVLEGAGQGHGIGLCQRGAMAMAEIGANYREILAHYFPNTQIQNADKSINH
jgi:stage II sporulation protein D (peptidoglycan lytic transglycosylase)